MLKKELEQAIKRALLLYNSNYMPYEVLKKNEYLFSNLNRNIAEDFKKTELSKKSEPPVETSSGKVEFKETPEKLSAETLEKEAERQKIYYCKDGFTYTRDINKYRAYEELVSQIKTCRKCPLWEKKTNYVPGEGDLDADIMFVGEAPGADEDKQGRPFVGRAGQLLTKILNLLGIDRKTVFIGNVLKCRPPGNRDPKPNEIIACLPYLRKQIEIIKPKVICTLGNFSTRSLLGIDTGITKIRGKVYKYKNQIPLVPTYHPSAALRNPSLKDRIIEDIRVALRQIRGETS